MSDASDTTDRSDLLVDHRFRDFLAIWRTPEDLSEADLQTLIREVDKILFLVKHGGTFGGQRKSPRNAGGFFRRLVAIWKEPAFNPMETVRAVLIDVNRLVLDMGVSEFRDCRHCNHTATLTELDRKIFRCGSCGARR